MNTELLKDLIITGGTVRFSSPAPRPPQAPKQAMKQPLQLSIQPPIVPAKTKIKTGFFVVLGSNKSLIRELIREAEELEVRLAAEYNDQSTSHLSAKK